jgi:hypothetical protein
VALARVTSQAAFATHVGQQTSVRVFMFNQFTRVPASRASSTAAASATTDTSLAAATAGSMPVASVTGTPSASTVLAVKTRVGVLNLYAAAAAHVSVALTSVVGAFVAHAIMMN